MATRLTFLCASATASSRIGAFPNPDEPLDEGGTRKAASFRLPGRRPDVVASSPARAAIATAEVIGIYAAVEPSLADLAFGRWSGRTFAEIGIDDAPTLSAWLADPTSATPEGESMSALEARVAAWLDRHAGDDCHLLAISHAAVIRAAIAHALSIQVAAAMRIDVAPLATLSLSYHGRWRLQELRRAR